MKTTETIPLFTLRSIWHRHLKETAIILAQPSAHPRAPIKAIPRTHIAQAPCVPPEKGRLRTRCRAPIMHYVPAALRSVLYNGKSYFPPTYKIHRKARRGRTRRAQLMRLIWDSVWSEWAFKVACLVYSVVAGTWAQQETSHSFVNWIICKKCQR